MRVYLEDGDGADGDQDNQADVHRGRELPSVVGVVVPVVQVRMVQHVVIVPPRVLILHTEDVLVPLKLRSGWWSHVVTNSSRPSVTRHG